MTETKPTPLKLGGKTFRSRLLVGTGKYADHQTMNAALEASGCEMVTVAIRRVDLSSSDNLLSHLDRDRYFLLPNTAGCFNAEDAIRVCHLSRELGLGDWVKLEVLGDKKTLLPDPIGTLEACQSLVSEGFKVMVYTSDDPVLALRLQDAGATSVMPAGSPIGSGQGILNRNNLSIILEQLEVPVIIDAGVGTASDVTIAMELGAEGVLLNTGIAGARDPVTMAHAMRNALDAGWFAARAGRIQKRRYAQASSPTEGVLGE
ncbi:MAG: thiazole synthase [Planctomycetes bacterium]|nr:thiazole synthase [Planctomycetota bacterium]MBT6783738.1 thiazole synthase [Planctomycetota bacterium]MBT7104955.1 thiazole synthase [Planctomycetota bacterium]MBT7130964.1 thiazole synthase [Planctomycetota bacterium]MBT7639353.1 thiazole synthase [Planctomycetota bacterium]